MQPEEIFQSLANEGVEYVLVGGLAATAHGASIVMVDTDICFLDVMALRLGNLE